MKALNIFLMAILAEAAQLDLSHRQANQGIDLIFEISSPHYVTHNYMYEYGGYFSDSVLVAENFGISLVHRVPLFGFDGSIVKLYKCYIDKIEPINGYLFKENCYDSYGGNNGINHGCTYSRDRFNIENSALYLDGTTDYVQLMQNINYDQLTLSHWFKIDSTAVTQMSMVRHRINGFHTALLVEDDGLHLFNDVWVGYPLNRYYYYASVKQDKAKWHHVVMTYDEDVYKFYYDGNLILSSSQFGNDKQIVFGNYSTVFGRDGDVSNRYFKGWLDDVLFFDRAITGEEVLMLYNAPPN